MDSQDPYATFPAEPGAEQMRWLIQHAAEGRLAIEEFIPVFQAAHERAKRSGKRPTYRSKEETRLIGDVLLALEFYSPEPSQEENPKEWNDIKALTAEVRRAARHLAQLAEAPKLVGDPRFETYPKDVGIEQLRWYIRQTAEGVLTIHEFLANFREVHERIEQAQRPLYASKEEAQAIWDVLWAAEYCSPDIALEESPEEWYIPEEVLMIIKQSSKKLGR
jgi:hypothetical protein